LVTAAHFLAVFVYHLAAASNAAIATFSEPLRFGSVFSVTSNRTSQGEVIVYFHFSFGYSLIEGISFHNIVLALDSSVLDIDQVENLIKFCPSKEEIEMLKGTRICLKNVNRFFLLYVVNNECLVLYNGYINSNEVLILMTRFTSRIQVKEVCFQNQLFILDKFFLLLQVNDLRKNLNTINNAAKETILSLGNALNQGTARVGLSVGFKFDSLFMLSDTRARNNMTLMHHLCKLLDEKMPELLNFYKDLVHLEATSKMAQENLERESILGNFNWSKYDYFLAQVLKNFLDIGIAVADGTNVQEIYDVPITIRIVFGFMFIVLIWKFDFAPFMEAAFVVAYANWGFAKIKEMGWSWAGVIWLYSLVTYIPS
ncbi:hypothetical protein S83_038339, partial [Arachis hypogaea]